MGLQRRTLTIGQGLQKGVCEKKGGGLILQWSQKKRKIQTMEGNVYYIKKRAGLEGKAQFVVTSPTTPTFLVVFLTRTVEQV